MPRTGDTYALPSGTAAASGEVIASAKWNSVTTDLAAEQNEVRPVVHGGTGVNNLTDLRTNMGALAAADLVGAIVAFAGSTPPAGWLECDGSALNRTTYADLYAAIGTTWGSGDGSTTFNIPDFRGEFLRGWDNGRGIDTGRALGSAQAAAYASHTHDAGTLGGTATSSGSHAHGSGTLGGTTDTQGNHTHAVSASSGSGGTPNLAVLTTGAASAITTSASGAHSHGLSVSGSTAAAGAHTHPLSMTGSTAASGGTETRPRNLAAMFLIRY